MDLLCVNPQMRVLSVRFTPLASYGYSHLPPLLCGNSLFALAYASHTLAVVMHGRQQAQQRWRSERCFKELVCESSIRAASNKQAIAPQDLQAKAIAP